LAGERFGCRLSMALPSPTEGQYPINSFLQVSLPIRMQRNIIVLDIGNFLNEN